MLFARNLFFVVFFIASLPRANGVESLPSEIQNMILLNAPVKDILAFCSTSKAMRVHCEDNSPLWQYLIRRDFPDLGLKLKGLELDGGIKELYKVLWLSPSKNKDFLMKNKIASFEYALRSNKPDDRLLMGVTLSNLFKTDLSNSHLQFSALVRDFNKGKFVNANLSNAKFLTIKLNEANLQNANLRNSIFYIWQFLDRANFSGADLRGAQFVSCPQNYPVNFAPPRNLVQDRASVKEIFDVGIDFQKDLTAARKMNPNLDTTQFARDNDCNLAPVTLEWLQDYGAIWDQANPPLVD